MYPLINPGGLGRIGDCGLAVTTSSLPLTKLVAGLWTCLNHFQELRDDAKYSRFFLWERAEAQAQYTPCRVDTQGVLGGVVGSGGESCWRG